MERGSYPSSGDDRHNIEGKRERSFFFFHSAGLRTLVAREKNHHLCIIPPSTPTSLGAAHQLLAYQDMWERRDLKLIGVLALREIILALDRERLNFSAAEVEPEMTAGSVCRQNCFTVKVKWTDVLNTECRVLSYIYKEDNAPDWDRRFSSSLAPQAGEGANKPNDAIFESVWQMFP